MANVEESVYTFFFFTFEFTYICTHNYYYYVFAHCCTCDCMVCLGSSTCTCTVLLNCTPRAGVNLILWVMYLYTSMIMIIFIPELMKNCSCGPCTIVSHYHYNNISCI